MPWFLTIAMDFKCLVIFIFVVGRIVSFNTGEIDDRTYNENEIQYLNNLLKKAFTCREVGDKIAAGLSDEDLKNMAKIPAMCECANYEL
ncbi:hypothetical protein LOAG_14806, partial [Loa loa]